MSSRTGFDVAFAAVVGLAVFLFAWAVGLAVVAVVHDQPSIGDNTQLVLVSAIGALSTIAGAALGYQIGVNRPHDQDPDEFGEDAGTVSGWIPEGSIPTPDDEIDTPDDEVRRQDGD